MTVFPEIPNLSRPDKDGIATLIEPHLTVLKIGFGQSLVIFIREGFKTDGASVPKEELENSKIAKKVSKLIAKHYPDKDYMETLSYLIGTPFEMPRLLAAIVHDALYDIHWLMRLACDLVYRRILNDVGYDKVRQDIEFSGIRLLGGKNWASVSDLKRARGRRLVTVEFVRTKKVEDFVSQLEKQER